MTAKRVILVLLFVLFAVALTATVWTNARADSDLPSYELEPTGDGSAGTFFSWATLTTYAGAVLFTTIATQYIKSIVWIKRIPAQVISYIVALIGLICGTIFAGETTAGSIALCFINALVVSLAANGTYNNVKDAIIKTVDTEEV